MAATIRPRWSTWMTPNREFSSSMASDEPSARALASSCRTRANSRRWGRRRFTVATFDRDQPSPPTGLATTHTMREPWGPSRRPFKLSRVSAIRQHAVGQEVHPLEQPALLRLAHPDRRDDRRHSKANCTSSGFETHSPGWENSIWKNLANGVGAPPRHAVRQPDPPDRGYHPPPSKWWFRLRGTDELMMNQRMGRPAQDAFKHLCSLANLTCNPSLEDDYGWDFLVEIPLVPTLDSPADKWPAAISAFVQVKSTKGVRRRTEMKVSNAIQLAKSYSRILVTV